MTATIATFYKFVPVADCEALSREAHKVAARLAIKGTILIAPEGLNATVSGDGAAVSALLDWLRRDARFADLECKRSTSEEPAFARLKVKVRREIVSLGRPDADPTRATGVFVEPADWNALISDPDVIVVDTRNHYEFAIGSFAGARDPGTRAFSEFPDYIRAQLAGDKSKTIATFCTGGIRCEKATAFLLQEGFADVYQLKGGILKYLEVVPPHDSLWQGSCFVFDGRVALEHGLVPGSHALCSDCGYPIPVEEAIEADSAPRCATCRNDVC